MHGEETACEAARIRAAEFLSSHKKGEQQSKASVWMWWLGHLIHLFGTVLRISLALRIIALNVHILKSKKQLQGRG